MPLRERLAGLCLRLAVIFIVASVLLCLPTPDNGDVLYWKNGLVAFLTVVAIGKTLFDTFFFDRFNP